LSAFPSVASESFQIVNTVEAIFSDIGRVCEAAGTAATINKMKAKGLRQNPT
jgi:hypothetical protein